MATTRINPPDLFNSSQYGFTQVVVATGTRTVYCSGQVAWDAGEDIGAAGDLSKQTKRSLENVARAVAAAGGTLHDVVSLRIYIAGDHIKETSVVTEALLAAFTPDCQPATTWIGVAALANPDFAIEIEAIAVLD